MQTAVFRRSTSLPSPCQSALLSGIQPPSPFDGTLTSLPLVLATLIIDHPSRLETHVLLTHCVYQGLPCDCTGTCLNLNLNLNS